MKNILVVGATSAIAEAVARLYAAKHARFLLVGRDEERLAMIALDLGVRGAEQTHTRAWSAHDSDGIDALVSDAVEKLGRIDLVLIAYGSLPDQELCQQSRAASREAIETNLTSVVELLTPLANLMESQGSGTLAVLSSVAGNRGRQSNYVYGAAKAGVTVFLDGLRNRLFRSGVSAVTIKLGFVDTPMTAHIETKGALWVAPKRAAKGIRHAIERRKHVAYVPWFWRPIMACIRLVPEFVFKRMRL